MDFLIRDRIQERISRVRAGNFGDFRSVGGAFQSFTSLSAPGSEYISVDTMTRS